MNLSEAMQERIKPVLFMLVFSAVAIALVSATHLAAAGAVQRNAGLYRQRAVMAAAGLDPAARPAEVIEWYAAWAKENRDGITVRDPRNNAVVSVVRPRQTQGLWGQIRGMVGTDPASGAITGVFFFEHNETPGLGARLEEPWFQKQFRGKTGPFKIVPEGTRSADPTEMDAITGATVTTTAVRDMLNSN